MPRSSPLSLLVLTSLLLLATSLESAKPEHSSSVDQRRQQQITARGSRYLLKYLQHQDQGAVVIASQGLLAFKGDRGVTRALFEMLEGPSLNPRIAAAGVLSEMDSEDLMERFSELYRKESEKVVRGILVRTVLQGKHPRRDEFLLEALLDADLAIREMAWGAVKKRARLPEVKYEPSGDEAARAKAVHSLRRWLAGNS